MNRFVVVERESPGDWTGKKWIVAEEYNDDTVWRLGHPRGIFDTQEEALARLQEAVPEDIPLTSEEEEQLRELLSRVRPWDRQKFWGAEQKRRERTFEYGVDMFDLLGSWGRQH